jgi:hypothetical protein
MNKRLDRLIAQTMAAGLNAQRFAKVARDWFSPSVPGGTRYAAMRLARTEINNAFHATSITYAQSKPWVSEMEWHLSKSHPGKDRCDVIAAESPYAVTLVPPKPHPQCMCYVTEVTPSEDEWIDRFVAGEFDDYLDGELAKADASLGIKPAAAAKTATGTKVAKQDAKSLPKPVDVPPVEKKTELTGRAALGAVKNGLHKRGSLQPKQRKAFREWESAWFSVINGFLRRTDARDEGSSVDKAILNTVAEMDAAFSGSKLSDPIQTWRGMYRARRLFGNALDHDLTGFKWNELGYSSTTYQEKIANDFMLAQFDDEPDNVKLIVHVDEGVGVVEVSTEFGGKNDGGQAEIALQRGLTWEVIQDRGKHPTKGYRLLEVRVSLPQTRPSTA